MSGQRKATCGHFRTYWCKVTDATGAYSIRYCMQCGEAVETRRGYAIAEHHQKAEAIAVARAPEEESRI